jgi:type II secretory pathway component GspD/PulD (secretin)
MSSLRAYDLPRSVEPVGVAPTPLRDRATARAPDLGVVSVAFQAAPAQLVLSEVAAQAGLTVVSGDWANAPVSVSAVNAPAWEVLTRVGAEAGMVPVASGKSIAFVKVEDAGASEALVLGVGVEDPGAVIEVVKRVVGTGAGVSGVGDRIVVTGPAGSLENVAEYVAAVVADRDGWSLDVVVCELAESWRRRLGGTIDVSGTIRLDGEGLDADGVARVLLEAAESGSGVEVVQRGRLHLVEGRKASLLRGDRVPVPRRAVSDAGTITTQGYDFIEAGFRLDATLRRVGSGAFLELEPQVSSITGYVDGVPTVATSEASVGVQVQSGSWAFVSGLRRAELAGDASGVPWVPVGAVRDSLSFTDVVVLVRAVRVSSAIGGGTGGSRGASSPPTESEQILSTP